ncbi:MAG: hypothetical protein JSW39_08325 [Desulfobacterales bacterium]|nr:MAG: hypothetical protein JSW39_08325 [Desulfobacterales bacterium]
MMSRKVLDLSLAIFPIVCAISLIVGIFLLRPLFSSSLTVMYDSHGVLQNGTSLLKELTEAVAEGKHAPGEMIKLVQDEGELVQEMARAIAEAKGTPKELAGLLQEIRLLVAEMKATVVEAKKSQMELAASAANAADIMVELGIAAVAAALAEQRVIAPTDADEMIVQSIKTIESRSARLGRLTRSLNDFRIRHRRPY